MKKHVVLFIVLGGLFLAIIAAFHPLQTANAKTCYDANQQVVPCPETEKKVKPTDIPPTVDPGFAVAPPVENSAPNPDTNTGGLPFSFWLFGLGGLFIGILIGLLVPFEAGSFINLRHRSALSAAATPIPENDSDMSTLEQLRMQQSLERLTKARAVEEKMLKASSDNAQDIAGKLK